MVEFDGFFINMCDQIAALSHRVEENAQIHWFLYALRPIFETFPTTNKNTRPLPTFIDLLSHTENRNLFMRTIHAPYRQSLTSAFLS